MGPLTCRYASVQGVAGVLVMTGGAYALNSVVSKGGPGGEDSKVIEKEKEREARASEEPVGVVGGGMGSAFSSSSDIVGGIAGGGGGGGGGFGGGGASGERRRGERLLWLLPAEPGSRWGCTS
jgi:hypothetical protein